MFRSIRLKFHPPRWFYYLLSELNMTFRIILSIILVIIICLSNISSCTFSTVTKVLLYWFVNSHRTFYNLQCSHRQVCTLEGSLKLGYKLDTSTIKTRNTFLDEVIVWRPLWLEDGNSCKTEVTVNLIRGCRQVSGDDVIGIHLGMPVMT